MERKICGCFKNGFQDLITCSECILFKVSVECINFVKRNDRKYVDEHYDVIPMSEVLQ